MRLLEGHRALVTGASRGLCLALLGPGVVHHWSDPHHRRGKLAGTPPFGVASQS